ncbi:uncharacterized protein AMSG_12284 [Thecamonas trahens ATCC 50062]|uniref:TRAF3-interacting protein 1 n=1 Tax=Thecamonas trahens ATCC 50062 TaxID=461836 RepID=A0A0L0DP46_THETB|nr:hypothetical protein AMSG_12284 [Thecamonas trahens ATCC 50062]KNC54059.1 hypothetical protein AMSG_12284 [Thecamonas trahens ATCC 50062]|eukprot:XP_013754110.1 hypothetical protein AMSG_12284 [Thecamonas trahens ATCC 50062]
MDKIKKTQSTLGRVISTPAMDEKVLARPPFRFLHDVVVALVAKRHFADGLFEPAELDVSNIKGKADKIAFLTKVIDVVGIALDMNVPVKPKKIVAGLEPKRTNIFLTMLAKAAVSKSVDMPDAVRRVRAGEHMPERGAAKAKGKDKAKAKAKAPAPAPEAEPQAPPAEPAEPAKRPARPSSARGKRQRPKQVQAVPAEPAQADQNEASRGPELAAAAAPPAEQPAAAPVEPATRQQPIIRATTRTGPPKARTGGRGRPGSGADRTVVNKAIIRDDDSGDDEDFMAVGGAGGSSRPAAASSAPDGKLVAQLKSAQAKIQAVEAKQAETTQASGSTGIILKKKRAGGSAGGSAGSAASAPAVGARELGELCDALQHAAPQVTKLGQLMDYVQEDMASMTRELNGYVADAESHKAALAKHRKAAAAELEPLEAKLRQVDEAIKNQLAKNLALKATIIRNDASIQQLLASLVREPGEAPTAAGQLGEASPGEAPTAAGQLGEASPGEAPTAAGQLGEASPGEAPTAAGQLGEASPVAEQSGEAVHPSPPLTSADAQSPAAPRSPAAGRLPAATGQLTCSCKPQQRIDGPAIACDECGTWKHMACVGLPGGRHVPETFLCAECAQGSAAAAERLRERIRQLARPYVYAAYRRLATARGLAASRTVGKRQAVDALVSHRPWGPDEEAVLASVEAAAASLVRGAASVARLHAQGVIGGGFLDLMPARRREVFAVFASPEIEVAGVMIRTRAAPDAAVVMAYSAASAEVQSVLDANGAAPRLAPPPLELLDMLDDGTPKSESPQDEPGREAATAGPTLATELQARVSRIVSQLPAVPAAEWHGSAPVCATCLLPLAHPAPIPDYFVSTRAGASIAAFVAHGLSRDVDLWDDHAEARCIVSPAGAAVVGVETAAERALYALTDCVHTVHLGCMAVVLNSRCTENVCPLCKTPFAAVDLEYVHTVLGWHRITRG